MSRLEDLGQEPVDRRRASDRTDWSGHSPSAEQAQERHRRLAVAWFEPLWKVERREAQVYAWRFTCPFCGTERQADHYQETYGYAYRHLDLCEWSDRFGLGPLPS